MANANDGRSSQDENPSGITIAKLVPFGWDAEDMFDRIVNNKELSEYHRSFIHAEPYAPSPEPSSLTDSEYESDRSPTRFQEASKERLWAGHYILSSDRPGDVKQTVGWRIGKGSSRLKNRGVDLLVTCPGGQSFDIAMVNALIQFHPESGVLMLRGLSDKQPIKYQGFETIVLREKDSQVLYQQENWFSLGKLGFNLTYEKLDDTQYTKYIQIRNRSLKAAGKFIPHPKLLAIPKECPVRINDLILHDNISSGAFGLVCAAIHARTGKPMAMKETWIKHPSQMNDNDFIAECTVSTAFKDSEGLLQAYTVECQHGCSSPCGAIPERFYMTFPLALHDFSRQKWSTTPLMTTLSLLKGPLQGLKTLHEAGYMHRDVSAKNLLIISFKPPKAVLCDYGKARKAPWHTNSRIGPIPTLAPEVDDRTRYDDKIDIWGLGYVCCWILFPDIQLKSNAVRPNRSWHREIFTQLSDYERRGGSSERHFADLIRQMLAWSPEDRITADRALQHPCIQLVAATPPPPPHPEERIAKAAKTAPEARREANSKSGKQQLNHEDESGDTEPLTPGARPPSWGNSA